MTLEQRAASKLETVAYNWLCDHWDELPLEGDELPLGWVDELITEFEAAIEDRAQEWLEKKR